MRNGPCLFSRIFNIFHIITFWMGLTFELRDVKNIVSDKPFVLIANHQTIIDVLGKDFKNKINIS